MEFELTITRGSSRQTIKFEIAKLSKNRTRVHDLFKWMINLSKNTVNEFNCPFGLFYFLHGKICVSLHLVSYLPCYKQHSKSLENSYSFFYLTGIF